jgi:hypothetical protein
MRGQVGNLAFQAANEIGIDLRTALARHVEAL